MFIRPSDGRRQCDGGVGIEGVLNHRRIDIVAAANDHILGPAFQPQVSVRIQRAQIAGVQPLGAVAVGQPQALVLRLDAIAQMQTSPKGKDLSSLRFAICGAAPMAPELIAQFEQATDIRIWKTGLARR